MAMEDLQTLIEDLEARRDYLLLNAKNSVEKRVRDVEEVIISIRWYIKLITEGLLAERDAEEVAKHVRRRYLRYKTNKSSNKK